MKKIALLATVYIASFIPVSSYASLSSLTDSLSMPKLEVSGNLSVGAGLSIRPIKFESGYGSNLLNTTAAQLQAVVGWKANDNFDIEASIFRTVRRNYTSTWGGSNDLGIADPTPNVSEIFDTSTYMQGISIGVVGSHLLYAPYNFKLLGELGLTYSRLKAKLDLSQTEAFGVRAAATAAQKSQFGAYFSSTKIYPHVTFGAEVNLTDDLVARGTVRWENTSVFKIRTNTSLYTYRAHARNTLMPQLTISYLF